MINDPATQATASFHETEVLAKKILSTLADEEASIGYGLLGCSLVICRLLTTGKNVSDQDEIEFIQALMEWTGAYFTGEEKGN